DPAMAELARAAGAELWLGTTVTDVSLDGPVVAWRDGGGASGARRAPVGVGADGPRSIVASAAGVARRAWMTPRIGLTYHLEDPEPCLARDARMRVFRDGY